MTSYAPNHEASRQNNGHYQTAEAFTLSSSRHGVPSYQMIFGPTSTFNGPKTSKTTRAGHDLPSGNGPKTTTLASSFDVHDPDPTPISMFDDRLVTEPQSPNVLQNTQHRRGRYSCDELLRLRNSPLVVTPVLPPAEQVMMRNGKQFPTYEPRSRGQSRHTNGALEGEKNGKLGMVGHEEVKEVDELKAKLYAKMEKLDIEIERLEMELSRAKEKMAGLRAI